MSKRAQVSDCAAIGKQREDLRMPADLPAKPDRIDVTGFTPVTGRFFQSNWAIPSMAIVLATAGRSSMRRVQAAQRGQSRAIARPMRLPQR
jgi:hypothetical protein